MKLNMRTLVISLKKIRPKYICCWLKDQLSRPKWFRNLIVDRSAWGAFSIYAHLRRSDNKSKPIYATKEKAEIAAFDMSKRYDKTFVVYKCLFCDGWHTSGVGKRKEVVVTPPPRPLPPPSNGGLNWEILGILPIPDLAHAYGGARGRTLSSSKQLKYWNKMLEAGVVQIIDLRADYISDFYSELCMRSGIGYFKYPVAYEDVWIAKMVELFPEFCSLIDNGSFYIACAMGLHRTDIALCTYWVFYAADKGIAPPELQGYRKDKGLNPNKIIRVLNAVYKKMTEVNGKEPIPEIVFYERKEIIKEMSKTSNKL